MTYNFIIVDMIWHTLIPIRYFFASDYKWDGSQYNNPVTLNLSSFIFYFHNRAEYFQLIFLKNRYSSKDLSTLFYNFKCRIVNYLNKLQFIIKLLEFKIGL